VQAVRHLAAAAPQVAELDTDLPGSFDELDLEEEFEVAKRSRSLSSIFSSGDEVLTVPAEQQDESLQIANCNLSDEVVNSLAERDIHALFPIQKHVYEPAAAGRDLIGRAKTGSGKTLAFALPVIEALLKENLEKRPARGRAPRCIVLAPTRELAKQVEREFAATAPSLTTSCLYGGVSIMQQLREVKSGVDVVVGTPGRIMDLQNRNALDLSQVRFAILDEADEMLSVGFADDVEQILSEAPKDRQTMLFSATMPTWVKQLVRQHLKDPLVVDLVGEAAAGKLAESIRALAVRVTPDSRRDILADVLTVYAAGGKAIVFTETKREADEVSARVAGVLSCEAMHGDISQIQRDKILARFREGKFNILVATDVAARGLDIPSVELVVHYDLPREVESFLHRSGRTGRAGKTGTTIAMFTDRDMRHLRNIARTAGIKNLEMVGPPAPTQLMEAAVKQVVRRLDNVDPAMTAWFAPAATTVCEHSDPVQALAAALAAMSGMQGVPKPRSLLTQEEGWVTLRVMSRPGRITMIGHIMAIVRNLIGDEATKNIGKVRMLSQDGQDGAAFDLPAAVASEIQTKEAELTKRGFTLDKPHGLPVEEDRFGGGQRDYSSRNGGRGGGGYGGGGRDNFRPSGRSGGRSNDRFGGGDRFSGRDRFGDRDRFGGNDRARGDRDRGARGNRRGNDRW
jgi:ATP-dependent RNA helicase DDX21